MTDSMDDLVAVGMLDEPVRRRLYEWVVGQGRPVGREEAAKAVGVGRALATFHLDRLAHGGLLETGYRRLTERRGPGAGRPARVYWRAAREFSVSLPERHYERAASLFAAALERLDQGAVQEAMAGAARDIGAQIAGRRRTGGSSGTRGSRGRGRLLTVLQDQGYEPVADQDGTIRLRNCPFHALVDEHRPLVCGSNLALAQGIVSKVPAGVEPVLDPQPGFCCVAFRPQAEAEQQAT
jgi:predicted ArsR family transcriptional regulator